MKKFSGEGHCPLPDLFPMRRGWRGTPPPDTLPPRCLLVFGILATALLKKHRINNIGLEAKVRENESSRE